MNHPLRGVGYVRVSTIDQVENESLATQEKFIRDFAERKNIQMVKLFSEEGVSAKTAFRKELQAMISYAIKNRLDYVVVYKMNRISRNMDSYSEIRGLLRSKGIRILSATEHIEDSPHGAFMENIFVANAQYDNDVKSLMTRDNMEALAKQGYWQHHPWLGYKSIKVRNDLGKPRPTMEPDKKAELVKDVLERFSIGDINKTQLTKYAKDKGLRSRNGKVLSKDSINRMLHTPIYAGYVIDRFTAGEIVPGKHQGLISEAIYERNQYLLSGKLNRKGEVHLKLNDTYPLKGLLICSKCKGKLYASAPTSASGKGSPRYHCSRKGCTTKIKSAKAKFVNDRFKDVLNQIKPSAKLFKIYREVLKSEYIKNLGDNNKRLSVLRSKKSSIEDSRLKILKLFADGELTLNEKIQLIHEIDTDKQRVENEIQTLESLQTITEADIDSGLDNLESTNKQWEKLPVEHKVKFQNMMFPRGIEYDFETGLFRTIELNTIYRLVGSKKGTEVPSKSDLVAGAGLEPATLWL